MGKPLGRNYINGINENVVTLLRKLLSHLSVKELSATLIGNYPEKSKGGICIMSWLEGKTAIIIGERDGVQAPSIAKCLETAGAKVLFAITECFV